MAAMILTRIVLKPPDPPTPLSSRGAYLGWHAAMATAARTTLIRLRMLTLPCSEDPWTRPDSRPDGQDSDHHSTGEMGSLPLHLSRGFRASAGTSTRIQTPATLANFEAALDRQ